MDLTNPEDLRTALKVAGIQPKHEMGQNFLADPETLDLIVGTAGITPDDEVLEIGPGLGTLTSKLAAEAKHVTAVEPDPKLSDFLEQLKIPNVSVVRQGVLEFDFRSLPIGYKVVSNIPYYLTSKIVRLLLEASNKPVVIVLLMQKEVAERICAKPGDLTVLALSAQYYANPEIIGVVPREKFWPSPKVDSAILKLNVLPQPVFPAEPQRLFRLIKAGFGERRKMLRNSLAGGLNASDELIVAMLKDSGISGDKRAQELLLEDWNYLYNEAVKHNLI